MASVTTIEGVGPKQADKLRGAGVRTCEKLLAAGATKKGRKELAASTGVGEKVILEWVNRADLMRIKGVSAQYSDLLEAAGVDTVKELRRRNAENLAAKMLEVNTAKKKKLVQRPPSAKVVTGWVEQAKELDPVVQY